MTNVHRFAGFEFDAQQAALRRPGGEIVRLRPKPLNMLQFLITNAGRVVTKQELMEAVWPNVHVGEDSLFQCIREIRSAIGDDRLQEQGQGYVVPDSFTHGTSAQRVRWFKRGMESGDVNACDTLNAKSL